MKCNPKKLNGILLLWKKADASFMSAAALQLFSAMPGAVFNG